MTNPFYRQDSIYHHFLFHLDHGDLSTYKQVVAWAKEAGIVCLHRLTESRVESQFDVPADTWYDASGSYERSYDLFLSFNNDADAVAFKLAFS